MATKVLGQVPSLFPHIKPDWWNLTPDSPRAEFARQPSPCHLVTIASARPMLRKGRHTINLAKRLPSKRAQETQDAEEARSCNTQFQVGDERQIPAQDGEYDLVILLGNSFGHGSYEDDLQVLRETYRVLKPGGVFVLDCVDGGWMRENSTSSRWEWLDPDTHFLSDPKARGKQLVVLRKRELSADGRRLASREIVIDLQGPTVHLDLFYAVQLCDMHEMEGLLRRAGLCKQSYESSPITAPK
ncbi:class I SAM-dependent methyltransferase [Aspergillus foveolatus]|uniref:class I SAM-dependent methyltransferase n=1 Tax=Aspergillus foveolatus TaxID=210207 RepID=UPI003CCCF16C